MVDFRLTEDQELLRASLGRFLEGSSVSTASSGSPDDWTFPHAKGLGELGVLATTLPEVFGGMGLGAVEEMVVARELGRAVVSTPYVESSVMGGRIIAALGSEAQCNAVLPKLGAGASIVSIAGIEALLDEGASEEPVRISRDGDTYRFDGVIQPVVFAPVADWAVVVARDGAGLSAFLVARERLPWSRPYWTVDDLPAASLRFARFELQPQCLLGPPGTTLGVLQEVYEHALTAQVAELVGLMSLLLNATIAHLKSRRQFGAPLASFQALQHRVADMVLAYEQAVSLMLKAAALCEGGASSERSRAVAAAKVQAVRSAQLIGDEAIQMHGAMGMTEELIVGSAVKRIRGLEARHGRPWMHLDRYRALKGAGARLQA